MTTAYETCCGATGTEDIRAQAEQCRLEECIIRYGNQPSSSERLVRRYAISGRASHAHLWLAASHAGKSSVGRRQNDEKSCDLISGQILRSHPRQRLLQLPPQMRGQEDSARRHVGEPASRGPGHLRDFRVTHAAIPAILEWNAVPRDLDDYSANICAMRTAGVPAGRPGVVVRRSSTDGQRRVSCSS
jgi:hypothetical protein